MKNTNRALLMLALALSACGEGNHQNAISNHVPAPGNVAVEELAAEPANSATQQVPTANDTAEELSATTIPAALHGRWGLTPADCTQAPGLGLVVLSADRVRFYESTAKPSKIIERTESRIRGEFDFVGEGGTWTNHMIWSAAGDKLTRVDSEEDSRQVYTRC